MRTFCLLLILGNALFFVWSQLIDVQVSPLDRARPPSATPPPRIVLAREVADESTTERATPELQDVRPPTVEPLAAREASTSVARTDGFSCTSVGPFPDLPQAAQAQNALRAAGFSPRQRVEEGELWVGYWVSVHDLPTRSAAEDAMKMLGDNGVTDVYLMPDSNSSNVLSLGVFSDYQRAQRRADQVSTLGLEPRVTDRKRSGSVYWLDVDMAEPGQTLDTSVFQTGETRIMRLELRACPSEERG